ncbi:two-component system, sporulation sensor kinase E [Cytobacillus horneckiae]|uniref:histidine kinase n=1 Tax=Cytobacillus horneckiae TaxID=549687 RepID=A0A2N0Z8V4_9BACI|nr:ATP-binding protein [Cytobacillus horneckiae]MBN6889256.1 PAS domain-containing protein [Cytobacillus horneckiae]MCM3178476.1 ATP-binding protein [Cytobacillus horneckiae]MEC1156786.1 ATP-binding protein [Cytobacillus horneckiae]MED2940546.1 ATP-binding protein [Cytobacillus horneckiae]PKG25944.1 PAS domain-containing sensor histidine kinase [Cytobacillus horneckiae]
MPTSNDWNQRRKIIDKLSQEEGIYSELFMEAIDGIVLWEDGGWIIHANESACRIFESSYEDLIQHKISDFIYQSDEKQFLIFQALYKQGAIRDELQFLMPNGQYKTLEFTMKLKSYEGYHMAIFRNVSERYMMEVELRNSELKFRKVFEGALEGIILWDAAGHIFDINPSAEKMLHSKKHNLMGKSLKYIITEFSGDVSEVKSAVKKLMDDGTFEGSIELKTKNDETKRFEYLSKYNLFSNYTLTTFKDITDKAEMEERLKKSDTLNVLGQLAAGIAHEVRNPMTAVKGFIQLLESSMDKEHSMYFNIISTELARIDSIINEFLFLSKPQAVKYMENDIIIIMRETVKLLNAQALLNNIQFRTYYEYGLPSILCEGNQLKKVFINIIKNAIEVMPKGGFITITIQSFNEDSVKVSIEDEGGGIQEDKLDKLGQPFFTTKERGNGLGLMVSYKIIDEHKGSVKVDSIEGKGTTFNIYLPKINQKIF